jgi:hypothetical protein
MQTYYYDCILRGYISLSLPLQNGWANKVFFLIKPITVRMEKTYVDFSIQGMHLELKKRHNSDVVSYG